MGIKQVKTLTGEMAVEHLVKRFEFEEKRKEDIIAPINSIRVNQDIKFETKNEIFDVSEQGFKQLCQQLSGEIKLPYDYLVKMHEKDPMQFASIVNYHLERASDTERVLRGMREEDGSLNIRGIVSKNYTKFDNLDALDVFMKSMATQGIDDYQLKTTSVSENGMFLRFVLPSSGVNFGSSYEGKEDWNYISIDLVNGEVGNKALKIISSVYRQVCTNGMVALDTVDSLNKRHSGQSDISGDMRKAISSGIIIGEKSLQELKVARGIEIVSPYETISKYAKQAKLSEAQAKTVRENYEIEKDHNLMSIINAFTRTARDTSVIDKRLELERFASRILSTELKRAA